MGILAAIAVPAYQDYTIRAQVTEGLNLSNDVNVAVLESYIDSHRLPANNKEAGLGEPNTISGRYVSSVEVADGNVVVTYGHQAHALILGQTLIMQISSGDEGEWSWSCSSPNIAAKHLPALCR